MIPELLGHCLDVQCAGISPRRKHRRARQVQLQLEVIRAGRGLVRAGHVHIEQLKAAPGGPDAAYKFAPDFNQMERRLRPRWLYPWLADPGVVYPGTTMTKYQWDDKDPERDADRRRATVEFILNYSRFRQGKP